MDDILTCRKVQDFPNRSMYLRMVQVLSGEPAQLTMDCAHRSKILMDFSLVEVEGQRVIVGKRTQLPLLIQEDALTVLRQFHDENGHPGRDAVRSAIMAVYHHIPKLTVEKYLKRCASCEIKRMNRRSNKLWIGDEERVFSVESGIRDGDSDEAAPASIASVQLVDSANSHHSPQCSPDTQTDATAAPKMAADQAQSSTLLSHHRTPSHSPIPFTSTTVDPSAATELNTSETDGLHHVPKRPKLRTVPITEESAADYRRPGGFIPGPRPPRAGTPLLHPSFWGAQSTPPLMGAPLLSPFAGLSPDYDNAVKFAQLQLLQIQVRNENLKAEHQRAKMELIQLHKEAATAQKEYYTRLMHEMQGFAGFAGSAMPKTSRGFPNKG